MIFESHAHYDDEASPVPAVVQTISSAPPLPAPSSNNPGRSPPLPPLYPEITKIWWFNMIFESHAHYDDEAFDEDRESLPHCHHFIPGTLLLQPGNSFLT